MIIIPIIPTIIKISDTNWLILIFPKYRLSVLKLSMYKRPIPYHIKYDKVIIPVFLLAIFLIINRTINPKKHQIDSYRKVGS